MSSLCRTLGRTLGRPTLADIALVCAADAVVGATFGAVAVAGGLPAWLPIAMSVLVFAGGAQIAAVGVLVAGGGVVAAVATGLALNTRLLPYSLAVSDVLDTGRWWTRLLGAHLVVDESVAFALRQDDARRRRAAYWLTGVSLFVCWNAAVVLGALVAGTLGNPDTFGLDAVFPAVMVALILPGLAGDRRLRTAAVLGALLAVAATPVLPAGLPLLLAPVALVVVLRKGSGDSVVLSDAVAPSDAAPIHPAPGSADPDPDPEPADR
ncbi:AzlC family ABC transporter permease [Catenulispora sp. NF23]|uniref:AzlC family ABC transporter permease n=1 Tax=Catenulispora pinistramenti TaxID=2705254 RepID=UPI001BAA4108|nr:AzlC family ABC transporter permease [Catenulispora pinistramenti]MBS2537137.1 AzlC family ABC transporter permease [Catenulispora pinistramenti]